MYVCAGHVHILIRGTWISKEYLPFARSASLPPFAMVSSPSSEDHNTLLSRENVCVSRYVTGTVEEPPSVFTVIAACHRILPMIVAPHFPARLTVSDFASFCDSKEASLTTSVPESVLSGLITLFGAEVRRLSESLPEDADKDGRLPSTAAVEVEVKVSSSSLSSGSVPSVTSLALLEVRKSELKDDLAGGEDADPPAFTLDALLLLRHSFSRDPSLKDMSFALASSQ